jgi:hypothetical protein
MEALADPVGLRVPGLGAAVVDPPPAGSSGEAQVPTHTHEDDWTFVMPPEERIGRPNRHRFTLPQSDSGFSQHNRMAHPRYWRTSLSAQLARQS